MDAIDLVTGEVVKVPYQTNRYQSIASWQEHPDEKSITETAYVPPQVQIQDMMEAGLRLAAERKARFDSVELNVQEGEDIPLDPTREPGVDLVDVQRAAESLDVRLSKAEKERLENAAKERERISKEELDRAVEAELERREKEKEIKPK